MLQIENMNEFRKHHELVAKSLQKIFEDSLDVKDSAFRGELKHTIRIPIYDEAYRYFTGRVSKEHLIETVKCRMEDEQLAIFKVRIVPGEMLIHFDAFNSPMFYLELRVKTTENTASDYHEDLEIARKIKVYKQRGGTNQQILRWVMSDYDETRQSKFAFWFEEIKSWNFRNSDDMKKLITFLLEEN